MSRTPAVAAHDRAQGDRRASGATLPVALGLLLAACGGGAAPGTISAARAPEPAPIPGPPGAVGTILLDVEDPRPAGEIASGLPRTIEAQVWYPAQRGARGARMPYYPRPALLDSMLARGWFGQPAERFLEWSRMDAHALRGALPAARTGGHPVALFSPARGVPVAHYTALLEHLAARGVLVVAVEPRVPVASAFRRTSLGPPAQDDVAQRATDLSIVLRRFIAATGSVAAIAQRADLTRAGAVGHGLGGLVALEACAREAVLLRCAALGTHPDDDSPALAEPALIVAADPDPAAVARAAALEDQAVERWRRIVALPGSAPARLLRLRGAGPMTFSDAPFVMPAVAAALGQHGDPAILHDITSELLAAFFTADARAAFDGVDAVDQRYAELAPAS